MTDQLSGWIDVAIAGVGLILKILVVCRRRKGKFALDVVTFKGFAATSAGIDIEGLNLHELVDTDKNFLKNGPGDSVFIDPPRPFVI